MLIHNPYFKDKKIPRPSWCIAFRLSRAPDSRGGWSLSRLRDFSLPTQNFYRNFSTKRRPRQVVYLLLQQPLWVCECLLTDSKCRNPRNKFDTPQNLWMRFKNFACEYLTGMVGGLRHIVTLRSQDTYSRTTWDFLRIEKDAITGIIMILL